MQPEPPGGAGPVPPGTGLPPLPEPRPRLPPGWRPVHPLATTSACPASSSVQRCRSGPLRRAQPRGAVTPRPSSWPVRSRWAGFFLQFVRQQRIDLVGAAVLLGFAAGVITSTLLGGNDYVLKVRDGFLTALFGVACIVTLYTHDRPCPLLREPLPLGREGPRQEVSAFDRLHDEPIGRRTFRVLSVVWGIGLVVEGEHCASLSPTCCPRRPSSPCRRSSPPPSSAASSR